MLIGQVTADCICICNRISVLSSVTRLSLLCEQVEEPMDMMREQSDPNVSFDTNYTIGIPTNVLNLLIDKTDTLPVHFDNISALLSEMYLY